jgi:serine/threonine protein kinase
VAWTCFYVAPELIGDAEGESSPSVSMTTASSDVYAFAMVALEVSSDVDPSLHHGHLWMDVTMLTTLHCDLVDESFIDAFFQLLTGIPPWHGYQPLNVILRVVMGQRPARRRYGSLDDRQWELLQACWTHNPGNRHNMTQVVHCLLSWQD